MTFLTNTASSLYDAALALFYPQPCAVCGTSVESRLDGIACARCWQQTHLLNDDETLCWKCGALSLGSVSKDKREQVRCRRCDWAAFTAARAVGIYEGALRVSVLALKRQPQVAARLLQVMFEACRRAPLNVATRIVPVPLHPERERTRGFNQAALLARELSRLTRLPFDDRSLVRTAHTERHRASMDAQARRESVENAFVVQHHRLIEGERILLVDDVFTTGATVSACATALKHAGASDVFVITAARSQVH